MILLDTCGAGALARGFLILHLISTWRFRATGRSIPRKSVGKSESKAAGESARPAPALAGGGVFRGFDGGFAEGFFQVGMKFVEFGHRQL
jgi:hypothetical protein